MKDFNRLNLRTMDIILCAGNAKLSRRIKTFNRLLDIKGPAAELTHAAMLSTADHLGFEKVLEATTLNKWADKRGVQQNLMYEWLRYYPGKVWVRRLTHKIDECVLDPKFRLFVNINLKKDYESGIPGAIELLMCGLRLNIASNLRNVHCSELVTAGYQYMGLLDPKVYPNNFPPYTFYENGDFEKHLIGCELGEMIRIK